MNVRGCKIGLMLKDNAVMSMNEVPIKIGSATNTVYTVNIRQVKKDFRPCTDYYKFAMRMV
jgi:hypothetical protein